MQTVFGRRGQGVVRFGGAWWVVPAAGVRLHGA